MNDLSHAEVMECMACSDNVVRAGLTIKHRDKDTLCQMLTYNAKSPQENKFYPQLHPMLKGVEIYDPPTPEFAVARIRIPQDCKEFVLPSVTGKVKITTGHTVAFIKGNFRLVTVWPII